MSVVAPRASADEFVTSGLSGWLARSAEQDPARILLRDQRGRAAWSGRPDGELSAASMLTRVCRLSAFLATLGLAPGDRVGLFLPAGSDACIALLAVEEAGLTACLMDMTWDAAATSSAIESAGIRALITQSILGAECPAERLAFVAAGFTQLGALLAFGPGVPEGVVDLDPILAGRRDSVFGQVAASAVRDAGIVTFSRGSGAGAPKAILRSRASLMGATATFLAASRIRAKDRVLNLLAPDDLKGLVTGFAGALLAGATLECHGAFDSTRLEEALASPYATHLVAPGWMEAALGNAALGQRLRSTILVHDAPTRFDPDPELHGRIVDVLALGETALLTGWRRAGGRFGISLDGLSPPATRNLLQVALDDDDAICLRGLAVSPADGTPPAFAGRDADGWRRSGYRANRVGGQVVGVS